MLDAICMPGSLESSQRLAMHWDSHVFHIRLVKVLIHYLSSFPRPGKITILHRFSPTPAKLILAKKELRN